MDDDDLTDDERFLEALEKLLEGVEITPVEGTAKMDKRATVPERWDRAPRWQWEGAGEVEVPHASPIGTTGLGDVEAVEHFADYDDGWCTGSRMVRVPVSWKVVSYDGAVSTVRWEAC